MIIKIILKYNKVTAEYYTSRNNKVIKTSKIYKGCDLPISIDSYGQGLFYTLNFSIFKLSCSVMLFR